MIKMLVSCNDAVLSSDIVKSPVELKDLFREAFEHYVGYFPEKQKEDTFIRTKEYTYLENGLLYAFQWWTLDN